MKDIKIEKIKHGTSCTVNGASDPTKFNYDEECIYIGPQDPKFPFSKNQKIMVFKDLSNIDTANAMLAVFGYKIVKPLIDFTKPLSEELKRLVENVKFEENLKIEQVEYRPRFYRVYYCHRDKRFWCSEIKGHQQTIGSLIFDSENSNKIVNYLNEHKEEALKAMEL